MSRSTAAALPFGLTEEQQTISGMVREFADSEIAPHALEWDAEHHFPVDVIKRSADLGMGGIYVSEEAGGTGMGRMDAALIFEAMSTACPSVAAYISIHNMVAWMIDKYGDAAQKEKYLSPLVSMDHLGSYCLTEPNAGSDAAALRTSAREDGDSYVLNGVKQFISGAGTSETYLVMARTGQDGSRGISAFILEKGMEGLSFGPNEQKMGWRAQPTRQVIMENVRVPKEEPPRRTRSGIQDRHVRTRRRPTQHRGMLTRRWAVRAGEGHRLHGRTTGLRHRTLRIPGPAIRSRRDADQTRSRPFPPVAGRQRLRLRRPEHLAALGNGQADSHRFGLRCRQ